MKKNNDQTSESSLLNDVNFLTMSMLAISRSLELPADQTMKDLPAHAEKIMEELRGLRLTKNKKEIKTKYSSSSSFSNKSSSSSSIYNKNIFYPSGRYSKL